MKYLDIFLGIVFLLFAIVQYNDPDFYIWIPVYSIISFIAFSHSFYKPFKKLSLLVSILLSIWMVTYIPDLITWIKDGAPNIAGTMQAESPHIELMRELFGIIICLATSIFYATKKT